MVGKDVSRHEALNLLGPDPTIDPHEPELQVGLDILIQSAYIRLVTGARRILEELNISNASETNLIKSP